MPTVCRFSETVAKIFPELACGGTVAVVAHDDTGLGKTLVMFLDRSNNA